MENKIKTINEFYLDQDDIEADELVIPKSVIEGWIQSIEAQEDSINEKIYAKEEMQKFLDDYYDNQIEPSDPDDVNRKHAEEIEPVEELSSDDENPNFIKKFEDS